VTRFDCVMTTYFAALGIGLTTLIHPVPKLIWNASASIPIGLYAVRSAGALRVTELLVVAPPEPLATFLDERRYLPKGVPLLKCVLALPGHTVCRTGRTITVDGVAMGEALDRDHLGRPLPVWQGCRVVAAGDVFLMNWQSEDSLDGRYFGPLPTTTIVGRADPLSPSRSDRVVGR
jgi:conjugative transfer signal peptidase TraF